MRDQAPIGYTCPDIDDVIGQLRAVVKQLDVMRDALDCPALNTVYETLGEQMSTLEALYTGRTCMLERLRKANETLRQWGNELYEQGSEDASEIAALRARLEELEDR